MDDTTRLFIAQLNELRQKFNPFAAIKGQTPADLVDRISKVVLGYRDDPVSRTFVGNLESTVNGVWDFAPTRNLIDSTDSNFIIGVFQNPYNENMGLDCLVCKQLQPDQEFLKAYPGKFSRVISLDASTEGFNLNSCVALFAEHYMTDEQVKQENKACYFVDRFVTRFEKITKAMLEGCVAPGSLSLVFAASPDVVLGACCVWLHLHEYCHRLGNMPLPEFLDMKTPRDAASIEELRVDVLTVLLCHDLADQGHPLAEQFGQIIFTERCFRYAVQYDINQNYDARGSGVLFGYLANKGVLGRNAEGLITVGEGSLVSALREINSDIDSLEEDLKVRTREINSQAKRALVKKHLHWNSDSRRYENHALMGPLAEELNKVDRNFAYAT